MNHTEFIDLHTSGVTAMRAYFDQAEKTTVMLAKCTAAPLPFLERLALVSQEIIENTAHADYWALNGGSMTPPGSATRLLADVNHRPVP